MRLPRTPLMISRNKISIASQFDKGAVTFLLILTYLIGEQGFSVLQMVVLDVQGNQTLARLESNREQDIVLGNDKHVSRQEMTISHGESTELTRLGCKDIQDPGKDLLTSLGL